MYEYAGAEGHDPHWRLAKNFSGDGPGYVGAIAWIPGTDRFLAVGGSGVYPRREPVAGSPDPAGMGRAWLLDHGVWRDLTSQLPSRMRGMAALDLTTSPAPLQEFGVAGALGQLWEWKDGHFADKIDASSVQEAPRPGIAGTATSRAGQCLSAPGEGYACPADFRFRVRDIRAQIPSAGLPFDSGRFLAVTAGCCDSASAANDFSILLSLDGDNWTVQRTAPAGSASQVSAYAVAGYDTSQDGAHTTGTAASYLSNTDGPERPAEPPSAIRTT